eukprot:14520-Rhodomonas_salina.1
MKLATITRAFAVRCEVQAYVVLLPGEQCGGATAREVVRLAGFRDRLRRSTSRAEEMEGAGEQEQTQRDAAVRVERCGGGGAG